MNRRNRCTRIVRRVSMMSMMSMMFMVICLAAAGCGREHSRDTKTQQPGPVAVAPTPAQVVQPTPVEPAPVVAPEPVEVAVVEPEPPVEPVAVDPRDYLAAADDAARRGDCVTALDYVRKYRMQQADNLMLRIREAGLSNDCGQPQRAIQLLIDLDAQTRAMEPVTAELADAYMMLNQPGKAAMTWELRYIVDQGALDAAVNASTLWLEAGFYNTAHWWFERAQALAPDAPEVLLLASDFEDSDT